MHACHLIPTSYEHALQTLQPTCMPYTLVYIHAFQAKEITLHQKSSQYMKHFCKLQINQQFELPCISIQRNHLALNTLVNCRSISNFDCRVILFYKATVFVQQNFKKPRLSLASELASWSSLKHKTRKYNIFKWNPTTFPKSLVQKTHWTISCFQKPHKVLEPQKTHWTIALFKKLQNY